MTIHQALQWGIVKLKKAGVDSPALDAEILLVHSAIRANRRIDKSWLYSYPDYELSTLYARRYTLAIKRRARREPISYITGHKEFYGLDFLVNRHVMIPRPETEVIVEEALRECKMQNEKCKMMVVDVGTGSGAIVVALAKLYSLSKRSASKGRLRQAQPIHWVATDISSQALRLARKNARRHGVAGHITFLRGGLLTPLSSSFLRTTPNPFSTRRGDESISYPARGEVRRGGSNHLMIVANLPYLPTAEWRATPPEIRKWEPRQTLDGGKDGLTYYRELFRQLSLYAKRYTLHATLLCELCPHQVRAFKTMVRRFFPAAKFSLAARHAAMVRM